MIKYIGSKRKLLPWIEELIGLVPDVDHVLDLFSGTARVGHALKRLGYRVTTNDHNAYAETLARCYVEADLEDVEAEARRWIGELQGLPGDEGPFTETYCRKSRYLHPKNGARIEAIRNRIAEARLAPELEAVLLVSLLEAADRVDSTTGVQMAFLKSWAPRAMNDLELRMPDVLPRAAKGKAQTLRLDAKDAAAAVPADLVYLDPPYNQHSYLGNYHVWESLVRWDHEDTYGIACKRVECKERRSPFNSKVHGLRALTEVVEQCRAKTLLVSFNDEGYIASEAIEALLARRFGSEGHLLTIAIDYARYVGARIGIHNPKGKRVGKVGRLQNVERLYLASEIDLRERLEAFVGRPGTQARWAERAREPERPADPRH